MRKTTLLLLLVTGVMTHVWSQAKVRRLPSIINHPSLDVSTPYISFDGNALLFVANNGQDGALTVLYTSRESDWKEPVELPKYLNTRLNFFKGYSLSADGKKLYFTCAKSPVIGGYDIFSSEFNGSSWSQPENLMLPINSKANDGSPSFSADGNTIYFMRCDKMDQSKAGGCKIFSAKKKSNGQWEEPVELPAAINTGNSQTPRIMADGETLIFSSDKMSGNKGGMDLYITKLKNGTWIVPTPLDFVNTDQDDQYVTVAALGRYLIKEAPGARKNSELTEFLIPTEIRPRGLMMIEGKVTDPAGAVIPAYISITDLSTNKRAYSGRPSANGAYSVFLLEGTKYEFSVDPEQSNISFFSKNIDLTSDKIPQKEKVNITLKQLQAGDEIPLNVSFKPASSVVDAASESELKRLARVAKANPTLKFEIQVLLTGYVEDTTQSSADLTELLVDSLHTKVDDIDSLGQRYKKDTVFVKRTFHNDRTLAEAQAVITYLVAQGCDPKNFKYFGNAIQATTPESKKLIVKAVARAK
ncbi:MAG TPA: hypothetical protein VIN08_07540 [Ohtaekwangia sp.]|uniref:hypothetical protein n=1 Tax=Ohtaekwangia sp. TaxID=2066019 RepID=UPI002F9583E8